MTARLAAAARLALLLAALGGCAAPGEGERPRRTPAPTPAPAPASSEPAVTPAPAPVATTPTLRESPGATGLAAFEARHREHATRAAQQQRWSEAAWAWEVVLALRPGDAAAQAGHRAALAAADAEIARRLPGARAAKRRGDWEQAERQYLEILAVAPTHAEAADALREIERQRSRRSATAPTPTPTPTPTPAPNRR